MKKSEIGTFGEDLVEKDLISKHHKIIARNYWQPWGEIDIIALSPDQTLVFFEVKTMWCGDDSSESLKPEDQMTGAKIKKLQRTASLYAASKEARRYIKKGWQIDLAAVVLKSAGEHTITY